MTTSVQREATCPFFTFQVELERKQSPLGLRLTESEGVKAFIRSEFQL